MRYRRPLGIHHLRHVRVSGRPLRRRLDSGRLQLLPLHRSDRIHLRDIPIPRLLTYQLTGSPSVRRPVCPRSRGMGTERPPSLAL